MNTVVLRCLFLTIALWAPAICAQITSRDVTNSMEWTDLKASFISRFEPPYNDNGSEEIYRELLDSNVIRLIAGSRGLSEKDLATVQLVKQKDKFDPNSGWVRLYQIEKPDKAFTLLSSQLTQYVQMRDDGHTKEFTLAVLTKKPTPIATSDPDLRVLLRRAPMLDAAQLRKIDSGTYTNKAGQVASISTSVTIRNGTARTNSVTNAPTTDEIGRWVSYVLIDGDMAWQYDLRFVFIGEDATISHTKCDAKEFDPKYTQIIKDVMVEVDAEMKRNGTSGKLGSIHTFWRLTQDKLKAKNIIWHSPAELNPNINYD
jgi:hypothetical protein